jgi:hypothetical protein
MNSGLFSFCFLLLLVFCTSCTSYQYSLVSNQDDFILLSDGSMHEIKENIQKRNISPVGSSVHTVKSGNRLGTKSFEQAIVYEGEKTRISIYTPNFGKLLYYLVGTSYSTLLCDVVNREAVLHNFPDRFELPGFPSYLSSISKYRAFLFAYVPDKLWDSESGPDLYKRISGNHGNSEFIVRGDIEGGRYESLVEYSADAPRARLKKALYFPFESKDVLEVLYEYINNDSIVPEKVYLEIREQSQRISYVLTRHDSSISGNTETIFSVQPPPGFTLYGM